MRDAAAVEAAAQVPGVAWPLVGALPPGARVYAKFAIRSFQKQLAYKFEYFVGVFNGLLFIFIFTSLWRAIYANLAAPPAAFNLESITAFAVFAMIVRISMTQDDMSTVGKIRSGAIALDMVKPMSYFGMMLAECLGQTMFHWFTRVIPVLIVSLLAFDAALPRAWENWALLIIAWPLGYLIMFMVNFIFALLAFWFIETFSFHLMKYGLFTIFSGGIVPVDFFPEWLKPVIESLPFMYILYTPTALFTGHIAGADALRLILLQGAWAVALGMACTVLWRAAQRKLVVQGG